MAYANPAVGVIDTLLLAVVIVNAADKQVTIPDPQ